MIIAGFQKLSLVDFPGALSSVIFVQGCNFKCGFCQNPGLVGRDKKTEVSETEILEFLSSRKKIIDGVVITGGEPCIYGDLPELIRKLKEKTFRTKLDTNGSNPELLEKIIREKILDYVALDLKTSPERYDLVADSPDVFKEVAKSIAIIKNSGVLYEFRTTCVPGVVGEEEIKKLGELAKGAKKYCLQQFRNQVTFDPAFRQAKPYTKEVLENFKNILAKYAEKVEIRGI
jgi:pyruvate formate lyase activating enzyme